MEIVGAVGLVTGSTHLGNLYSTEPVSPIVESIEHITIPIEKGKPIYRQIGNGWYVYSMRW